MKTELFISWRYLAAKRKEKFISLIGIISIFGIAIGVAALIVVIAVMTGFDKDLREKIVGNYSHITLAGFEPIKKEEAGRLVEMISANAHVTGVSPYVQGQVLIKEEKQFFAVGFKGIDPAREMRVTKIEEYLTAGSLAALDTNGIIVGRELAMALSLRLGSPVTFYSAQGKEYNLKISGIFNSGMYDYDMNLVFMHINTAQEVMGLKDAISAMAIKLDDLYLADKVRTELGKQLGLNYSLKTWIEMNRNFFAALELEKLTMFIILTLIILVAAFNIASMLIVMVVEKTKDIGILRAIGMSSAGIRRIFTYQGMTIGILGICLGFFLGTGLCWLLKKYQFIKLPQDIYYIDRLPVSIDLWPDIALIVGAAFFVTLVSTIYPAAKAAGLKPVEALRYE